MPDYSKTKIFTIRNTKNDKKYVGNTTSRLTDAFCNKKKTYKNGIINNPLLEAFEQIGIDNFYIQLEEEVSCKNKDEVNVITNNYITKYDTKNNGYNYIRSYRKQLTENITENNENNDENISDKMVENSTSTISDNITTDNHDLNINKDEPNITDVQNDNIDDKLTTEDRNKLYNKKTYEKFKLPSGVYITSLTYLDNENPYRRLDAYKVIAKQVIKGEIKASQDVIRLLRRYLK